MDLRARTPKLWGLLAMALLVAAVHAADWPTYQLDAARSGRTAEAIKPPLAKVWTYEAAQVPRPAWPQPGKEVHRVDFDYAPQPVAAEGRVFFASSADDTVRALDAVSGSPVWQFTAGGPVRLAPTIADGRCCFGSDDGRVYCLDAATGQAIWTFRAAPADRRLLGNGRLISRWPVRTGVLVEAGVAYAAAGMWPGEGVYVYALDFRTGRPIWRNDTSGSMYIEQPHRGASAFTGVSPQGYLLASGNVLLVPTGRSIPAAFDLRTGRLLHYRPAESKYDGGAWATIAGDVYLTPSHPRQLDDDAFVGEAQPREGDGMMAYDLATGERVEDLAVQDRYLGLADGGTLYAAGAVGIQALDLGKLRGSFDPNEAARWTAEHGRAYCMALAERTLLVGGVGTVTAYDAYTGRRTWRGAVGGQARGLAIADGRVLVSTDRGEVTCFARCEIPAPPRRVQPALTWQAAAPGEHQALAAEAARAAGARAGYALVVGPDDANLAVSLALRTDLHVIAVVAGEARAAAERKRALTSDLYGSRLAVLAAEDPAELALPRYFADLVIVAPGPNAAKLTGRALFQSVRPCGGVLCLAGLNADETRRLIDAAGVPPEAVRKAGRVAYVRRGSLAGSAEWRYPEADGGRSGAGADTLVRLPLELLWFGGPGPDRMMDRHWGTTTPLYAGGRVFVTGQHHVIAFDAYNGREHWARALPEVGRTEATWRSGSMVADDDSLYVLKGAVCHRLDQATGRSLAVYQMPAGLARPSRDPTAALAPVDVAWPKAWRVFGPVPKTVPLLGAEVLARVPAKLQAGGRLYAPRTLQAVGGVLDFTNLYGGFGFPPLKPGQAPGLFPRGKPKTDNQTLKQAAYAFAEIDCPAPGRLIIGAGSDWWMAWYLDGKPLFDTLGTGNRTGPHQITDFVFAAEVSKGRHVLAVAVQSGSRGWSVISAGGARYEPQLAEHLARRPAAWGYLSVAGGLLLGTHYDPELWPTEATALFALDRRDGAVRWVHRPKGILPNTSVAHADGRVFVQEAPSWAEVDKAQRRGEKPDRRTALVALDLAKGAELWRRDDVPPTPWRMVQHADGVVVVCGTVACDAATGRQLWHVEDRGHVVQFPPVIVGQWVFTHPGAYDLKTGRPRMTDDLLTGERRPWKYVRAYGCGPVAGGRNLLFFRSGTAGFLDLLRDGTTTFGAVRPNCSVSMIAAGGVLAMPEGSSGCTCSYNYQTSVALAPAAGREDWYVLPGDDPNGAIRHLRLNFGAPGDRRDGPAAWLAFPRPDVDGAAWVPLEVDPADPNWTPHRLAVQGAGGAEPAWLYEWALPLAGELTVDLWHPRAGKAGEQTPKAPERTFTVRLHFVEPEHAAAGRRVFDVSVQGRPLLKAFDIAAAAGGAGKALVRELRGVRAAETLSVRLTPRLGTPVLAGLEVLAE